MEIWKQIDGYENYEISITGLIRKNGVLMKPYANKKNDLHQKIKLTKDGVRKVFYVHQLVARAYIPNPDNLPEVNHIDHNPLNNSVTNLEWVNHKANCRDASEFKSIKKLIENPHLDLLEPERIFTNKRKVVVNENL